MNCMVILCRISHLILNPEIKCELLWEGTSAIGLILPPWWHPMSPDPTPGSVWSLLASLMAFCPVWCARFIGKCCSENLWHRCVPTLVLVSICSCMTCSHTYVNEHMFLHDDVKWKGCFQRMLRASDYILPHIPNVSVHIWVLVLIYSAMRRWNSILQAVQTTMIRFLPIP